MHDLPLATEGLTSYRYRSRYGYIMIGAKDHPDALKQAARSTQDPISPDKLDVWNGQRYTPAIVATA